MKANELRIGNIIQWISTGSIEIVLDIHTFDIRQPNVNNVNISDCLPIPLTEEWLLKFGFIDNNYTMDLKLKSKSITAKWYSKVISTGVRNGWYFKKYRHIKYVHQLQNLYFALTGEELTIKDK